MKEQVLGLDPCIILTLQDPDEGAGAGPGAWV